MSNIIELIKQLRDRTGAGLMDCKKALIENGEDLEKAALWLREKGIAKQEKKASRTAAEGVAWVKTSGNKAAIIEINCETDFVANSDPFRELVKGVNDIVLAAEPKTKEEALACTDKDGKSIKMYILCKMPEYKGKSPFHVRLEDYQLGNTLVGCVCSV